MDSERIISEKIKEYEEYARNLAYGESGSNKPKKNKKGKKVKNWEKKRFHQ